MPPLHQRTTSYKLYTDYSKIDSSGDINLKLTYFADQHLPTMAIGWRKSGIAPWIIDREARELRSVREYRLLPLQRLRMIEHGKKVVPDFARACHSEHHGGGGYGDVSLVRPLPGFVVAKDGNGSLSRACCDAVVYSYIVDRWREYEFSETDYHCLKDPTNIIILGDSEDCRSPEDILLTLNHELTASLHNLHDKKRFNFVYIHGLARAYSERTTKQVEAFLQRLKTEFGTDWEHARDAPPAKVAVFVPWSFDIDDLKSVFYEM
ncbi:hypothetical protein F5Y18DRAFT_427634 [Xylariaceae sp. FL1019]|nr:hypothetical protein F5Y18DRAFT_427634 [Xylariaceae sp. FL1019]